MIGDGPWGPPLLHEREKTRGDCTMAAGRPLWSSSICPWRRAFPSSSSASRVSRASPFCPFSDDPDPSPSRCSFSVGHGSGAAARRRIPPPFVADRVAMPQLVPPYAPIRVAKKLEVGTEVLLDAGVAKSLRFRQINEKEAFTLRDVEGVYFRASLLSATPDRAIVAVYERMASSPESDARITLVCAILARQRMLMVAQKATELGVTRILPVF